MFSEIIDNQIQNKNKYIREIKPPEGGLSIDIKDNKITVIDGTGWIHPTRKAQYVELIQNCLGKFTLKDSILNINLTDLPMNGYLNFCRVKGKGEQFVLPNHRFTRDDIQILGENTHVSTYDETVAIIRSNDRPISEKINKIYTSCIPHKNKRNYFIYALDNDFCTGYMYIGSVHGSCDTSPRLIEFLKRKSMAGKTCVPFIDHSKYKYVLYNDGNTLSDRMRLLLCLNSVIIKSKTRYEEFYSHRLTPDVNYIEYERVEDLKNIYRRLEKSPELVNTIIENNKIFINQELSYDNILQYTADIINLVCAP
jgi:hypothetical protein